MIFMFRIFLYMQSYYFSKYSANLHNFFYNTKKISFILSEFKFFYSFAPIG